MTAEEVLLDQIHEAVHTYVGDGSHIMEYRIQAILASYVDCEACQRIRETTEE